MAITPTNYFDYDTTPFMQTMNKFGANTSNGGGYGLNKINSQRDSLIPRTAYNPNKSLYADNSKAASLDAVNSQDTESQPISFNIQGAHQAIDDALPAMMPGDGGVGDATAEQQAQQVKQDLSTVASSGDPDAVAKSLLAQPGYSSGSFAGGLMMSGLAIMSGANPLDAAKAGIQGQEYFDNKDRKSQMSDSLKQNVPELLKHYTQDSISAAISNGDQSLLQLRKLTPEEQRAQALEDEDRKDVRQQATFEQQNRMLGLREEAADKRKFTADAVAADKQAARQDAAESKATAKTDRDYTKDYLTGTNKFVQFNARQSAYTEKAQDWYKRYNEAVSKGDTQSASKYLDFAAKELENSQIVGQRSSLPEEIQAAQTSGGVAEKLRTHIEQLKSGTIDKDAETAFSNTVNAAFGQEKHLIDERSNNDYMMHRQNGYSPEQSAKLVNSFRSRVGVPPLKPSEFEDTLVNGEVKESAPTDNKVSAANGALNQSGATKSVSTADDEAKRLAGL